jgi:hypothetical protein
LATLIPKEYNKHRIIRNRTAGAALAGGDLVCFNSSGAVILADADAVATQAIGAVLQDYDSGDTGVCIYKEFVRDDQTGLTDGGRVYLSGTAGGFTQTAPSGAADVLQVVGTAISDTEIAFDIAPSVIVVQASGSSTAING